MITNFNIFGIEHIISIIIPIIIGIIFIILTNKYPEKKRNISIILAITIIIIRSIRYGFDIYIGDFKIYELLSLHICHIDLILLVICLIKPNRNIFAFNLLIGIPTALSVVLMPGQIHQTPGMLRAIFFIMSHMMLVMGAIYTLIIYKFKITKKDLIIYYIVSSIGMIIMYIFDTITKSNFMYLIEAPKNTVLEILYNNFGSIGYVFSIYILLILLITILYLIYKFIYKNVKDLT